MCWLPAPEHRTSPGVWLISGVIPLEDWFFVSQKQSVVNVFFLGNGTSCPVLFCAGILSSVGCHSLCEFVCTSTLLWMENTISLKLFKPSNLHGLWLSVLHPSLSLEGRSVIQTSHSVLGSPRSLSLCKLTSCGPLCWSPTTPRRNFSDEGWSMCSFEILIGNTFINFWITQNWHVESLPHLILWFFSTRYWLYQQSPRK